MRMQASFDWLFNSPSDAGKAVAAFADREAAHVVSSLFVDDEQVAPIDTTDVSRIEVTAVRGKGVTLWRVKVFTSFIPFETVVGDDDPEVAFSPALFDGEELPDLPTYAEVLRGTGTRSSAGKGFGEYRISRGEADDWRVL